MSSSKIFQMKIDNITDFSPLEESVEWRNGYECRSYTCLPELNGLRV